MRSWRVFRAKPAASADDKHHLIAVAAVKQSHVLNVSDARGKREEVGDIDSDQGSLAITTAQSAGQVWDAVMAVTVPVTDRMQHKQ